jgi:arsenate reductase-like glutaredoxin family protein
VDASKNRFDEAAALALLDGIDTLVAARGKTVESFDLRANRPDDAELLARLMGPTGNLRAPTARVGRTLLVGFNPDAYKRVLG